MEQRLCAQGMTTALAGSVLVLVMHQTILELEPGSNISRQESQPLKGHNRHSLLLITGLKRDFLVACFASEQLMLPSSFIGFSKA
jgi:hypothetical protein